MTKQLNHDFILKLFVSILALIAVLFLVHGFYNLITPDSLPVDLALRYWHTKQFLLEHIHIYLSDENAIYPPSFFVFLFPLWGWIPYNWAAWSWAIVNAFYIGIISFYLFQLTNKNQSFTLRLLLPLSFLVFHSIAQGLGVGQVTIFIVGNLILFLWIAENQPHLLLQILAILALSISLNKFSLLIPIAIVLFIRKEFRMALITAVLLNLAFSWIAMYSIQSSLTEYFQIVLNTSAHVNKLGTLDVLVLIDYVGLPSFLGKILGIILIGLLCLFLFKYKDADLFTQLALAALTARFFLYHAHYDNVILLFLVIAIWKQIPTFEQWNTELILFILLVSSLLIPARFLEWHAPNYGIFLIYQLLVWGYASFYLVKKQKEFQLRE